MVIRRSAVRQELVETDQLRECALRRLRRSSLLVSHDPFPSHFAIAPQTSWRRHLNLEVDNCGLLSMILTTTRRRSALMVCRNNKVTEDLMIMMLLLIMMITGLLILILHVMFTS